MAPDVYKRQTRDKTKEFITNAEKWTQKAFKENAESANEVRNTIKKKLREEDSINIENLATEMFHDNEEAKESFNTYLLEKGFKDTIDLDKNYIEKKLKRVRLKIDKNIDIYLSEEAYNDNMRFEIKPNGDGSVNMIIKKDVYKRQEITLPLNPISKIPRIDVDIYIANAVFILVHIIAIGIIKASIANIVILLVGSNEAIYKAITDKAVRIPPVSYTPLDVYKRQGY